MSMNINKEQVAAIARSLNVPGLSYLMRVDRIARALGYENQAALMSVLGKTDKEHQKTQTTAVLCDWRHAEGEDVHANGIAVTVEARPGRVDVSLGGAEKDYCGPQASIVSIEREGDTTRFLIYDSVCDAPRVFGVPDGQPLRELPNDWEKMDPQGMEP